MVIIGTERQGACVPGDPDSEDKYATDVARQRVAAYCKSGQVRTWIGVGLFLIGLAPKSYVKGFGSRLARMRLP